MHILSSREGRRALAGYAAGNVLLAFDYDGTLAPTGVEPVPVGLRRTTRALLRTLSLRYPVAVITDRQESDVARLVADTDVWAATGHRSWLDGSSPGDTGAAIRSRRDAAQRALNVPSDLASLFDDIAIVLRDRTAPRGDADRVFAGALGSSASRVVSGRVVNVAHSGTRSKGAVLARLCRAFGCDSAVYVGDGVEDEEVFRVDAVPVLGIRVGPSTGTVVAYHLTNQSEVDRLLRRLCNLRPNELRA